MKTPQEYFDSLEKLTDEFAKLSAIFADLKVYEAQYFGEHRHEFKSDNACEKSFRRTEKGIEMEVVKMKLKSKEKQMSTCKTGLRLLDTQARNII